MPVELFTWNWWLGTDRVLVAAVLWALAAVAVQWLRYDATVWGELRDVARRHQSIADLYRNGRDCDRCSLYWLTLPVAVWFGPVVWLAVNGAYLLLEAHLPTLAPPPVGPPPGTAVITWDNDVKPTSESTGTVVINQFRSTGEGDAA